MIYEIQYFAKYKWKHAAARSSLHSAQSHLGFQLATAEYNKKNDQHYNSRWRIIKVIRTVDLDARDNKE